MVAKRTAFAGMIVIVVARPGLASFRVDAVSGEPVRERMAEVFELRYIVETAAAALAARRRHPADLEQMRGAVARMSDALAMRGDGTQADDDFHVAIAAATGNALLQRFIRFMGHQFFESRVPT